MPPVFAIPPHADHRVRVPPRPAGRVEFRDLLRPQVEYLYRLAWRFTGSVADAEDLVQEY